MVKKIMKYAKFMVCIILMVSLIAPSYAALSASDGSAFVTKAEFDSALADFNARLTTFEAGINSKIDSQVTSYLDRNGIWNAKDESLNKDNFQNQWATYASPLKSGEECWALWSQVGGTGSNYSLALATIVDPNVVPEKGTYNMGSITYNFKNDMLMLTNANKQGMDALRHWNDKKNTGEDGVYESVSWDPTTELIWFTCEKSGLLHTMGEVKYGWTGNASFTEFGLASTWGSFRNYGMMLSFALGAGLKLEEWKNNNFLDNAGYVGYEMLHYQYQAVPVDWSGIQSHGYSLPSLGFMRMIQMPTCWQAVNSYNFVKKGSIYLINPYCDWFDDANRIKIMKYGAQDSSTGAGPMAFGAATLRNMTVSVY